MRESETQPSPSTRERLLEAARTCFLNDEFHKVSTRQIAAAADANVSMIRYYFGNKLGLYEEMIRDTLQPMLDMLDGALLSSPGGDFFRIYYDVMLKNPTFPRMELKVLALNDGPGKRVIQQIMERGRIKGARTLEALKESGAADPSLDPDIVRIAFVSLAMMPMLLKDVLEEQMDREMDTAFIRALAEFNGRLFSRALAPDR